MGVLDGFVHGDDPNLNQELAVLHRPFKDYDCAPDLIEIKCPWSCALKDRSVLQAIEEDADFFLESLANGEVALKRSHSYHDQIQGQLDATDTVCCDLVVWSPTEDVLHVVRVVREYCWQDNKQILLDFYFKKLVPSFLS